MTTVEATKSRSGALIQSIRSSSWESRIAVALIAVLLVLLLVQAVREPGLFFSQLVIGVTNGAIIALIALGYTLVYGIIELINFAHGDNFMIGSFVGLTVLSGTIFGLGLFAPIRSEEHTSELQSRQYLVCRLLLEKKNHDLTIAPLSAIPSL